MADRKLNGGERYRTTVGNALALAAIAAPKGTTPDLKEIMLRKMAGVQLTQTEFLFLALSQILEEIDTIKSHVIALDGRPPR